MSKSRIVRVGLASGCGLALVLLSTVSVLASGGNITQPVMGTAANFAVIAGSTVASVPPMQINGNLALSPGSVVAGGPSVTGASDIDNSTAVTAQNDLTTAYTDAMNATPADNITTAGGTTELGDQTLTPGVYDITNGALLDGTLTLNGEGQTNPTFIFQFSSSLITGSGSSVVLEDGAGACALYWQVTSDAILGSTTNFQGNLMTQSGITMGTGSNIGVGGGINGGRALVSTSGALTADGDNIITPPPTSCVYAAAASTPTPTPSPTGSSHSGTPVGDTGAGLGISEGLLLFLIGLALVGTGTLIFHTRVSKLSDRRFR